MRIFADYFCISSPGMSRWRPDNFGNRGGTPPRPSKSPKNGNTPTGEDSGNGYSEREDAYRYLRIEAEGEKVMKRIVIMIAAFATLTLTCCAGVPALVRTLRSDGQEIQKNETPAKKHEGPVWKKRRR